MARIPDVSQLDKYTPDGRQSPSGYDTRQVGDGTMALGRALEDAAVRAEERRNKIEMAKADADFRILKSQQDRAYDQDDDYQTIPERYNTTMTQGVDEILTGVTDPRVRNLLQERYRAEVGIGTATMGTKAWDREVSVELGAMDDRLHKVFDEALTGDDRNFLDSFGTIDQYLNAVIDAGYIDDAKAAKLKREWQNKLAVGRLEMYDPKDRVGMLRQSWAKNLPANTRAKLMREATNANKDQRAYDIARSWENQGLSIDEQRDKRDQIGDADLADKVTQRIERRAAARKEEITRAQSDLYNDIGRKLILDNVPLADIPWEQKSQLNVSQLNNLGTIDRQKMVGARPKHSNREVLYRMMWLHNNGGVTERDEYFMENSAFLNDSDFKEWGNIVSGAENQTGYLTSRQYAAEMIDTIKISNRAERERVAGELDLSIDRWVQERLDKDGRLPGEEETKRYINWWFKEQKDHPVRADKPIDLDEEDREEAIQKYREVDEEIYTLASTALAKSGYRVTLYNFELLFNDLLYKKTKKQTKEKAEEVEEQSYVDEIEDAAAGA